MQGGFDTGVHILHLTFAKDSCFFQGYSISSHLYMLFTFVVWDDFKMRVYLEKNELISIGAVANFDFLLAEVRWKVEHLPSSLSSLPLGDSFKPTTV